MEMEIRELQAMSWWQQRVAVHEWMLLQLNHRAARHREGSTASKSAVLLSSKVNATGFLTWSISQPQRRQYTKGPEDSRAKSNQPLNEQERIGTGSRDMQRSVCMENQRQGVATEGVPAGPVFFFFDSVLSPDDGAGEGD